MQVTLKKLIMVLTVSTLVLSTSQAAPFKTRRFFHGGDGRIRLASEKNNKTFDGAYRSSSGRYGQDAYRAISAVFGADGQSGTRVMSLRLVEFMDYLQDHLGPGALITITSGYRPSEYNANLRKRGALAAKASLHQYGMAVDFFMEGVPSKRVWDHVKVLGFGGAGYYHGKTVHIDVGPARFWDEKTSGVGTGLSDDNKLIGVVTDYDIYSSGEIVELRFIRMTAFPIQLHPEFELLSVHQASNGVPGVVFRPASGLIRNEECAEYSNIGQMASFRWELPPDLSPGRYVIRARFCGNPLEKMPKMVATPEFEVRLP